MKRRARIALGLIASVLLPLCVWAAVYHWTGSTAPTGETFYWYIGYPSIVIAAALLSWLDDKHWWVWPPLIFSIQFLIVTWWSAPGEMNLWPIGVVFYLIYTIPVFVVGGIAAYLARRRNAKGRGDTAYMTRREKVVIATAISILSPVLLSIFILNRTGHTLLSGDLIYWIIGYPALLALSVLLAWINPRYWWAWPPLMTAAQFRTETSFDYGANHTPLIVILGLWIAYTIPLWIVSGLVVLAARRRKQSLVKDHG